MIGAGRSPELQPMLMKALAGYPGPDMRIEGRVFREGTDNGIPLGFVSRVCGVSHRRIFAELWLFRSFAAEPVRVGGLC
jgi:hypothetical protein